jgi:glyoxylase-like metal-dependent hydrolase (beta-lactamase superfamily II)
MSIEIRTFRLGPLETNAYLLVSGPDCWVVDPGWGPGPLLEAIADADRSLVQIWLTHGHGDHIGGVGAVRQAYPHTKILCPADDAAMLPDPALNMSLVLGVRITSPAADVRIRPGQEIAIGQSEWRVLDTSGHTPGGVSFYCEQAQVVLTGDALFRGSIGRTDIPNGDPDRLANNIRQHLYCLPPETRVLPGHGPETTIGQEMETNPFVRA